MLPRLMSLVRDPTEPPSPPYCPVTTPEGGEGGSVWEWTTRANQGSTGYGLAALHPSYGEHFPVTTCPPALTAGQPLAPAVRY